MLPVSKEILRSKGLSNRLPVPIKFLLNPASRLYAVKLNHRFKNFKSPLFFFLMMLRYHQSF
jgi:hypothetical protein